MLSWLSFHFHLHGIPFPSLHFQSDCDFRYEVNLLVSSIYTSFVYIHSFYVFWLGHLICLYLNVIHLKFKLIINIYVLTAICYLFWGFFEHLLNFWYQSMFQAQLVPQTWNQKVLTPFTGEWYCKTKIEATYFLFLAIIFLFLKTANN